MIRGSEIAHRNDCHRVVRREHQQLLETISASAPISDLVPMFRRDHVAIVMDGDAFLGVATRLDLINYFRITP